jgi:hypothetical protein
MELIVLLDTNVVLARCLDPSMDAKGRLADEVFRILSDVKIVPCITESVRNEFDVALRTRVGQILEAVRELAQQPAPVSPQSAKTSLEMMEDTFARLRSAAPNASTALQLLETRLARGLGDTRNVTEDAWRNLLRTVAVETSGLLAEIGRRCDTCRIEVIRRPSNVDHEKFRPIVPKPDLEHIASAAGLCDSRRCRVVFVTFESPLHAAREEISKVCPDLVVTTSAYLRGQIQRVQPAK